MKASTVVPAYNEEKALRDVVEEYLRVSDEVVVVDDCSSDDTFEIGKKLSSEYDGVVFVSHEVNKGKPFALRTGVENCSGDVLVFTDADMTYPARYVPEMVERLNAGADMVLGDRISKGSKNIPFFNRVGNRFFSYMVSFIGGSGIKDAQTGLRVLRKEDYENLDVDAESLEFETKMTVRASKLGYRIEEIPIEYRERVGEAKLNPLKDGWRMFASVPKILFKESSPILKTGIVFSSIFGVMGLYTGLVSVSDWIRTGVVSHEFYPILTALFLIIAFQTFTSLLVAEQQKNRFRRLEEKILDE